MRVLFITEFFPLNKKLKFTGGVETRVFHIAKILAKKGHQVLIICRRKEPFSFKEKEKNIHIYFCGLKRITIEANFFSIFERIIFIFAAIWRGLRLDFDVVEGTNFVCYLPAFILGVIKKKPKVCCVHDFFGKEWFKNFSFITGIFGSLAELVSLKLPWEKIIAVSKTVAEKLIKKGIPKNKIEVIYGGVDFDFFSKNCQTSKIINRKKNIVFIGRLVPYKRAEDLIEAFGLLIGKNKDLFLIIVGQGPEEGKLKKLVQRLKLTKKVRFLKKLARKKIVEILKKAYLFCLPSVVEGFGLVTIEAAACGVPYVIADIKVNREITHNGQGGLLFKKGDIKDLKEKILLLVNNKRIYQQKKREAIFLAQSYNWNNFIQKINQFYSKIKRI